MFKLGDEIAPAGFSGAPYVIVGIGDAFYKVFNPRTNGQSFLFKEASVSWIKRGNIFSGKCGQGKRHRLTKIFSQYDT